MNDFQFGDYPYNNEIIEMPNRESIGELDIYPYPESYFSKEFLYSLDDNIEKWKNPELCDMCWFRWITGHQTMLVLWYLLSKELFAVINTSNMSEIEQKLNVCIKIFLGCSVIFEYTGSCPQQFYHSTVRPYMALFHRGFSGTWSVDYELIPQLVNQIIKTNYPDSLNNTQQEFKQSFLQHQKSHYAVAKKLVPSSASLLKEAKKIDLLEVNRSEEHNVLFDYFFLVKRVTHPKPSLLYSLSKRIKAIIIDLTINEFYVGSDSELSLVEFPEKGASKHQSDIKSVLFESAKASFDILQGKRI
ncbi:MULTISPECIES: hypothetical protein [unclassified Nostoc]|uniref:hypothetical protein n=1 Tax=unclassified Nostoc TaxID=2593658 RepID=UPI00261654DA|nr:hypothetical protein [Nostoc sp. S13]MDF5736624.1 hypothetical protein [Nostoc sp. S13]